MKPVTVISALMGMGKTTWAIQYMKENVGKDKRFLYVTPFLDEVENRVLKQCSFMFQPETKYGKGSKLNHFKQMLREGTNIATTHALFEMLDDEVFELINGSNYTLILDEVFNVIKQMDISSADVQTGIKAGNMRVINGEGADRHRIEWLKNDYDNGVFAKLKYHAQNGNAYSHDGKVVFWTFPAKMFDLFDESYILTYLFEGQIQAYYYQYHNVPYQYKSVTYSEFAGYELCEYTGTDNLSTYKPIIKIYKGSLNTNFYNPDRKPIYDGRFALSFGWFDNATEDQLERLKKNLYTYFRNEVNAKSDDIIWTTRKSYRKSLQGKGYTKGFIVLNQRATNEYKDRHNLAYVYNRFMNPSEKAFFRTAGIEVNEDLLALSDLLQWIWRSGIRNNPAEPINIYIPSTRMRNLLEEWLDG